MLRAKMEFEEGSGEPDNASLQISDDQWRMLHPASVFVNLIPHTWRVIRSAWPIFLVILFGGQGTMEGLAEIGMIIVFLGLTVGGTVLHFLTLRYRVREGRLELKTGLFNRQLRVLSADRIQNTERVQNIFQKALNLVEVRIETASGQEAEGLLSALDQQEAARLKAVLDGVQKSSVRNDEDRHKTEILIKNSVWDLFHYGATATRFGAIVIFIGLGLNAVQRLESDKLEDIFMMLGTWGAVILGIGLLAGAWVLGVFNGIIRHYGFLLAKKENCLVTREGLFTQREIELPLKKVQMVTLSQPWLRRMAGFGSVYVETAAGQPDAGGTKRAEAVVPVVPTQRLMEVANYAVPQADVLALADTALLPPHRRALLRAQLGNVFRGSIVAIGLTIWFWPYGLFGWILLPAGLYIALLEHRVQGWLMTKDLIICRQGYLNRYTHLVAREKLQSIEVLQGPILKRHGLGRLILRAAGKSVALPLLGWDQANAMLLELSESVNKGYKQNRDLIP